MALIVKSKSLNVAPSTEWSIDTSKEALYKAGAPRLWPQELEGWVSGRYARYRRAAAHRWAWNPERCRALTHLCVQSHRLSTPRGTLLDRLA